VLRGKAVRREGMVYGFVVNIGEVDETDDTSVSFEGTAVGSSFKLEAEACNFSL
jgi:hypothetical protein